MTDEKKSTLPSKPMSNKEIALALLVSHIEDSISRLTDEQVAIVAGKSLRGARNDKIREFYKGRAEKAVLSMRKLLQKRGHDGRITSFVGGA
jgi:hypothetical protein